MMGVKREYSFSLSLPLACILNLVLISSVTCQIQSQEQPPTVRLFQVDASNRIVKVLSVDPSNHEIVLDEGIQSLRLECTADYPVQFVYSGNGIPVMDSSITHASHTEFKATAFVQKVTEQHTGKYKCSSTESPNVLSYVYIYVPGPVLFNTNSGKTLDVTSTTIQIPCTASSPRVSVYLQKPVGDPLERPGEYDPRRGFIIYVERVEKAQGVYLCKANFRGITNVLEYKVNIASPSSSAVANSQRDEGSKAPRPSSTTSSSSPADNKKPEFEVEDDGPCNPPCAENAKCLLQAGGRRATCQCLAPFKGDAYGSCQAECSTHTDCPDQYSCFADYKCRNPCTFSLHGLQCGRNAVCRTVDHRPTCACPKGYGGDPMKSCDSRSPVQGDAPRSPPPTSTPTTTSRTTRRPSGSASASGSSSDSTPPKRRKCDCGPENENECECICISDSDCDNGKFCNGTICMDPCDPSFSLCGTNAICTAVNGIGYCSCPENHRGDPWKKCRLISGITPPDPVKVKEKVIDESSAFAAFAPSDFEGFQGYQGFESTGPGLFGKGSGYNLTCLSDTDCPTKYICDLEVTKMCMDPCLQCAENAECDLWDGAARPHCRCPEGYTGDGVNSCYEDVTFELTGVRPPSTNTNTNTNLNMSGNANNANLHSLIANKACSNTSCGPHSECRVTKDGLPKCNCISGYVGQPPRCRQECSSHTDCRDNQLCVLKKCRNICRGHCGKYARCIVDTETRTPSCKCRQGYTGDPMVECAKTDA